VSVTAEVVAPLQEYLGPRTNIGSSPSLRLIQGGVIDLVRHLLSSNDQSSIKIAE